jgi:hypothetical protein
MCFCRRTLWPCQNWNKCSRSRKDKGELISRHHKSS